MQYPKYILTRVFSFALLNIVMKKVNRLHKKNTTKLVKKNKPQEAIIKIDRTLIIFSCLLFIISFTFFCTLSQKHFTQSVAGASIFKPLFVKTTITLPQITGAIAYNIYYKATSDKTFIHAVRN